MVPVIFKNNTGVSLEGNKFIFSKGEVGEEYGFQIKI
jgi:hypothetical protein